MKKVKMMRNRAEAILSRPSKAVPGRKPSEMKPNWLAGAAIATALFAHALSPTSAQAQALQGTFVAPGGGVVRTVTVNPGGTTTDTIQIDRPTAVINWTPNTQSAGATPINFLAAGDTANFVRNGETFTVLNRIIPVGADANRRIAINGTVNGLVNGVEGGKIWFYTPNGFLIGAGAKFSMGGLILSTLDHPYNAQTGDLTFAGSLVSNWGNGSNAVVGSSNIDIAQGAEFKLSNEGSYLALLSPKITQRGTISVNGSTALVAAEAVNMQINTGLFNIEVASGTTDTTGIEHSGVTGGPQSTGPSDFHTIYMVAVPKNQAMTMLLSGSIGFDATTAAQAANGSIILSAGHDFTGGQISALRSANASGDASISIVSSAGSKTSLTNNVIASATGSTSVVANSASVTFTGNAALRGAQSASLLAENGQTVSIGGDLKLDSSNLVTLSGQSAQGGAISLTATGAGSRIAVTGAVALDSSAVINIPVNIQASEPLTNKGREALDPAPLGSAAAGSISLNVDNGAAISADAINLVATGVGSSAPANALSTAGGNGSGGAISANVTGGTLSANVFSIESRGIGGDSSAAFTSTPDLAGSGTGGAVSFMQTGGTTNFGQFSLVSEGIGGSAGSGIIGTGGIQDRFAGVAGNGTGGTVSMNVSGGTFTNSVAALNMLSVGTGGLAGDNPAGAVRTGGTGTGGDINFTLSGTGAINTPEINILSLGEGYKFRFPTAFTLSQRQTNGGLGIGGNLTVNLLGGTLNSINISAVSNGDGGSGAGRIDSDGGRGGDGTSGSILAALSGTQISNPAMSILLGTSGHGGAGGSSRGYEAGCTVSCTPIAGSGIGGDGGQATGGNAQLIVNFSASFDRIFLDTSTFGGDGGSGGSGGSGGNAQAGNALLSITNGRTLTATGFTTLDATAIGGLAGAPIGAARGLTAGAGGSATGGNITVSATQAARFVSDNLVFLNSSATGQNGNSGRSGSTDPLDDGGKGGSATAGSITFSSPDASGTLSFSGLDARATASAGSGGSGSSPTFSSQLGGNGGNGGSATGGNITASQLLVNSIDGFVIADASADANSGGDGANGGNGGNAAAGNASVSLSSGTNRASFVRVVAGANDRISIGNGGSGRLGAGGTGGSAVAGNASLNLSGATTRLDVANVTLSASAIGGGGGSGRQAGLGGSASAGSAAINVSDAVLSTDSVVSGGSISLSADGFGGFGGDGLAAGDNTAFNDGGNGGSGGAGNGGVARITVSGSTGLVETAQLFPVTANSSAGGGGIGGQGYFGVGGNGGSAGAITRSGVAGITVNGGRFSARGGPSLTGPVTFSANSSGGSGGGLGFGDNRPNGTQGVSSSATGGLAQLIINGGTAEFEQGFSVSSIGTGGGGGASGTGGIAEILISNGGSLSSPAGLSVQANGAGGSGGFDTVILANGANGGAGFGGSARFVTSDPASSVTAANLSLEALGTGGVGANVSSTPGSAGGDGGLGAGGTVTLSFAAEPKLTAIRLDSSGQGGDGGEGQSSGQGGAGIGGGNPAVGTSGGISFIQTGGTATYSNVLAVSTGIGGNGRIDVPGNGGRGGNGLGGSFTASARSGAALNLSGLSVVADGQGGVGSTAGNGNISGNGGAGTGGSITLEAADSGSTLSFSVGQALSVQGLGGAGGDDFTLGIAGDGGSGIGGTLALIGRSGGTVSSGALLLLANGRGGNGGQSISGGTNGLGAIGTGGTVALEAVDGSVSTGAINALVDGYGGLDGNGATSRSGAGGSITLRTSTIGGASGGSISAGALLANASGRNAANGISGSAGRISIDNANGMTGGNAITLAGLDATARGNVAPLTSPQILLRADGSPVQINGTTTLLSNGDIAFAATGTGQIISLGDLAANARTISVAHSGQTDVLADTLRAKNLTLTAAQNFAGGLGSLVRATGTLQIGAGAGGLTTGAVQSTNALSLISGGAITGGDAQAGTTIFMSAVGTGPKVGNLTAGTGITLNSPSNITLGNAITTSGNITLNSTTNITAGNLNASGGTVVLNGLGTFTTGLITVQGDFTLNNSAVLKLGGVSAGDDIRITSPNAITLGALTARGDAPDGEGDGASISVNGPSLTLGNSEAVTGSINLISTAGNITTLGQTAQRNISNISVSLLNTGNTLSRTGNISLISANAMVTGNHDAQNGSILIQNSSGSITAGVITLKNDLTLTTNNDLTLGGITAGDDIRITTGGAARYGRLIALGTAGSDNETDGSNIALTGAGAVFVDHAEANDNFTVTAARFETGPNTIITGGDIDLSVSGDILLGNSQAGGFLRANSDTGNISFGTITSGGNMTLGVVDLTANTGARTITGIQATSNGTFAATAVNGIDIQTVSSAGNLTALIFDTGTITLGTATSGRSIGVANFVAGNIDIGNASADGDVIVSAQGNVTMASATARGLIPGSGGGGFTLAAGQGGGGGALFTGYVFVGGTGSVTVTDANAQRSIGLNGATVNSTGTLTAGIDVGVASADSIQLNQIVAGDDIGLFGSGPVSLANGRTTGLGSDTENLQIQNFAAIGNLFQPITVAANGSNILLVGGSADGSVTVGSLDANNDIGIGAFNAITYGSLVAGRSIFGQAVGVTSPLASITGGTARAGNSIALLANDQINIGAVTATTGFASVGTTNPGGTTLITGPVTAATTVDIVGTTINASDVTGGGLVQITATGTARAGNVVSTGASVNVTAVGGITTGNLTTNLGGVNLANTSGVITTGQITSRFPFSINTASALQLAGVTSTFGDINIITTSSASVGNLRAIGDGSTSFGTISVRGADVTTGTGTANGSLTLTSTVGGITSGNLSGTRVTLNSATTINSANIVSSPGDITLNAVRAITTGNLTATTGSVSIANSLLNAAASPITTGVITVGNDFTLATGSNVSFAGISVGDDIRITTTGTAELGNLFAGTAFTGTDNEGDGRNIALTVTGALTVAHAEARNNFTANSGSFATGLNTIITGGNIDITSPGDIALGNSQAGGFLRANAGGLISFNTIQSTNFTQLDAGSTVTGTQTVSDASIGINAGGNVDVGTATANGTFQVTAGLPADGNILIRVANPSFTNPPPGSVTLGTATARNMIGISALNVSGTGNWNAGEDVLIAGNGTVNLASVTSGNDIDIGTPGAITIGSAVSTGLGADTRIILFGPSPVFSIQNAAGDGADITINSTGAGLAATNLNAADDLRVTTTTAAGLGTAQAGGLIDVSGDSISFTSTQSGGTTNLSAVTSISGDQSTSGDVFTAASDGGLSIASVNATNLADIRVDAGILSLGTVTSAGDILVRNFGTGLTEVTTSATATGDILIQAGGNVSVSQATAQGTYVDGNGGARLGNIFIVADGNATMGPASALTMIGVNGANVIGTGLWNAGEDILVDSLGTANLTAASAGDDLDIVAPGGIIVTNGTARAVARDNRSLTLIPPPSIGVPASFQIATSASDGSDIRLNATGGGVTSTNLTAGDDVTIGASGAVVVSGTILTRGVGTTGGASNISITAGLANLTTNNAFTDLIVNTNAGAAALSNSQAGRLISANSSDAITFGTLTSGANTQLRADTLVSGTQITAQGDVIVRAFGNVSINSAAANGTFVDPVSGVRDGNIFIISDGDTSIANANARTSVGVRTNNLLGAGTWTAGEDIYVQAGGTASLASASAGDDIDMIAPGSITLTTGTARADARDDRRVQLGVNAAGVQAFLLTTTAGDGADIRLTATGGGVTSATLTAGDDIDINASGAVAVTGLARSRGVGTTGGASNISITAGSANVAGSNAFTDVIVTTTGDSSLGSTTAGGRIVANAGGNADYVSLTSGTSTAVVAGGALVGGTVSAGTDALLDGGTGVAIGATTAGQDVTIIERAVNGPITLTGAISAGRNVSLIGGGALTGGAVTATTGDISFTAQSANLGQLSAGGAITGTTSAMARIAGATAGGAFSLTAGQTNLGIIRAASIQINSGQGVIFDQLFSSGTTTLTAGDDVVGNLIDSTGALTSTAGRNTNVTTVSSAAQITMSSVGTGSFGSLTSGGGVTFSAGNGVTGGAVNAQGNIAFSNLTSGGITLGNVTSAAGSLSLGNPFDASAGLIAGPLADRTISTGALTAALDVLVQSKGNVTIQSATAGNDVFASSSLDLNIGNVTAGRDLATVSGASSVLGNLIAGRDLGAISAAGFVPGTTTVERPDLVRNVTIASATAGDDVTISALGALVTGALRTTGLGQDGTAIATPPDFVGGFLNSAGSSVFARGAQGVTVGTVNSSGSVQLLNVQRAFGGATFGTGTGGLNAGAVTAAAPVIITSDASNVALSTVTGSSIAINTSGSVTGNIMTTTGGNLVVNAPAGVTFNRTNLAGGATLNASTGDVVIAVDAGATGSFDATGRDVALTATGPLSLGTINASRTITATSPGLLGVTGTVNGQQITLSSADIAISPTAQLGSVVRTTQLTLSNSGTRQTQIGGSGGTGYTLSATEISRIAAGSITINAPVIGGPAATALNSSRTPDVLVGSFTVAAGTNLGPQGSFTINNGGKVRVTGQVSFTGMNDSQRFVIRGDEAIEILDAGSIVLNGASGLAGTLDLTSHNVVAASSNALTDFGNATTLRAISDRAGNNDGRVDDGGYLQAGAIRATLLGSTFIVQNTGSRIGIPRIPADFQARRGFTVGSGGLTVISPNANAQIVLNGRQVSAAATGGFITGIEMIKNVSFLGAAGLTGSLFNLDSTLNGCFILNPASCQVNFNQIGITRDTITVTKTATDKSGEDSILLQFGLVQLKEAEGLDDQPIIDDPVTGAGNDDLWAVDDEQEKAPAEAQPN